MTMTFVNAILRMFNNNQRLFKTGFITLANCDRNWALGTLQFNSNGRSIKEGRFVPYEMIRRYVKLLFSLFEKRIKFFFCFVFVT